MNQGCPLSNQEITAIKDRFQARFGKEPSAIHLVGSHAEGVATADSDIDLVVVTDIPGLTKRGGPGFDFMREINGDLRNIHFPSQAQGVGSMPGGIQLTSTPTLPGDFQKAGVIDISFGQVQTGPGYFSQQLWP